MASWRFAQACVIGTSHAGSDTPLQDWGDCALMHNAAGEPVLVAVASDGAGSAILSQEGAATAGAVLMELARAQLVESKTIDETFARTWINSFQHKIEVEAKAINHTPKDYACTILVAIISVDEAFFWQIGDGAIVYTAFDDDTYHLAFSPAKGEYANATYFATDEFAQNYLQFRTVPNVSSVALLTDGIERLALDFKTSSAYSPFFRPMFAPLEAVSVENEGEVEPLSKALQTFLDSPLVNERTDDDKTLILATRR